LLSPGWVGVPQGYLGCGGKRQIDALELRAMAAAGRKQQA